MLMGMVPEHDTALDVVLRGFLALVREGPTFIEAKTMRMHGHSEHDSAKYVPRELLEEWKKKDPIMKTEQMLVQLGYGDENTFKEIGERATKEVEVGVEFAEQSPMPEGPETLEGVFAEKAERY